MRFLNKKINKSCRGFTLVELMLVMTVAAVMMSLKMQDDQLEMTQLQARKLGATELFVYNLGVQKHLSQISGVQPNMAATPPEYPKVYTGVNWLKKADCPDPLSAAEAAYVPCHFLQATGGRTTVGSMTFTTRVDYDPDSGYTATTTLSPMSGTAAGESNSGFLGMAALVASGAFIGSDASASAGGSGGSIIYCPDITPMPAAMAGICGSARDQIVMIVNTNGANDTWLRVDHGNLMAHAIEYGSSGAVPTSDADLALAHPSMRQIRNVAKIYNASLNAAGNNQSLYIGNRVGAGLISNPSHADYPSLADNAVIIDADQEIVGRLVVQDGITVNDGGIIVESGDINASSGSIIAQNDIRTISGNASINGWITGGGTITSSNGDLVARNGDVISSKFVDSNDTRYVVDPNSRSYVRDISTWKLRNNPNVSSLLDLRSPYIDIRRADGSTANANVRGYIDVSRLYVQKNGYRYTLEQLLPNLTFVGSYKVSRGDGSGYVNASSIETYCGGSWRTRVYVIPLKDTISSRVKRNMGSGSLTEEAVGSQARYVTRSAGIYRYYARGAYNYDNDGSVYDRYAEAILQFYCHRP